MTFSRIFTFFVSLKTSKISADKDLSSSFAKQVADAVHVEGKGETKCLVQWVALCSRDNVAGIEREHVHLEACTYGEVGTVTFVGMLVVVAGTQEELVVVGIFETRAPLDFLQLFLKSVRGIVE